MGNFLDNQVFMAVELEATPGTAETLVDADGGIVLESHSEPHDIGITQQNSFSNHSSQFPAIPGKRIAAMEFSTMLRGSAAVDTPPSIDDLLQLASFSSTVNAAANVTYKAISNNFKTGTIGVYYPQIDGASGLRHLFKGAVLRGLRLTFTNGQPPILSGQIVGVLDGVGVTQQTPLNPTFDTILPQAWLGATLTLGGTALKPGSVTVDFGLSAIEKEDVALVSGVTYFLPGYPQRMTITMDPEQDLPSVYDPYTALFNKTQAAFVLSHGTGAGSVWTLTCPKHQFTSVQPGSRNGLAVYNTVGNCNVDSVGDDHFTLVKT